VPGDTHTLQYLRRQGKRLGRAGLSQRVNDLVAAFAKEHPEGHYREAIMLAGRLHAIFLSTDPHGYWREVAERGFAAECEELRGFETRDEGQDKDSSL
jgi:hypothetical protein